MVGVIGIIIMFVIGFKRKKLEPKQALWVFGLSLASCAYQTEMAHQKALVKGFEYIITPASFADGLMRTAVILFLSLIAGFWLGTRVSS